MMLDYWQQQIHCVFILAERGLHQMRWSETNSTGPYSILFNLMVQRGGGWKHPLPIYFFHNNICKAEGALFEYFRIILSLFTVLCHLKSQWKKFLYWKRSKNADVCDSWFQNWKLKLPLCLQIWSNVIDSIFSNINIQTCKLLLQGHLIGSQKMLKLI